MRNIRRLVEHGDLCRRLAQVSHESTGIPLFRTFRELSCFAAVLGLAQRRERALDGPTELFVDARVFESSETAVDVAYIVGLAATEDPDVLLDSAKGDEVLAETFERYAAGGLAILQEWLDAEPSDAAGDKAVLTALRKGGYLERFETAADAVSRVTF